MPGRAFHEESWQAVPEGLQPSDAQLREGWLLSHVAHVRDPHGGPPRVLDLGCGEGRFTAGLARAGAQVVGADVAVEPLRRARAAHRELELRLIEPEAALPFEDCSFDAVWAGETIEHIADTASWLSEVRRVLRSGGTLLISTPDHGALRVLWIALWARSFDAHFDPRSEHLRFYTRRTLAALLADFCFERVDVRAAGGLPGARRVLLASAVRARF